VKTESRRRKAESGRLKPVGRRRKAEGGGQQEGGCGPGVEGLKLKAVVGNYWAFTFILNESQNAKRKNQSTGSGILNPESRILKFVQPERKAKA
jgi:hypothetical protein